MGLPSSQLPRTSTGWRRDWLPGLLVVAIGFIPVWGVFTSTRMFFIRDLTLAFHSRFLWLRHTIFQGHWPWWDPFPAGGQSAAGDALYQIFLPPTLLLRLILPELPAWNLWVALPVPLCALGAWIYLRRHVGGVAALLGGIAFGLSGPITSTPNFPNLSWSVAAIPYVLWALDRVRANRRALDAALLATLLACQGLAGEPVTLAATLALAAAYAVATMMFGAARSVRALLLSAAGVAFGLLMAAIQFVPLLAATRASVRTMMGPGDFWSFHPIALIELLVPHFFGDYFHSYLRELAWMVALNSGREPFYYTMYIGVSVALIAGVAALALRRATTFWITVLAISVIAALGAYTPVYPFLQRVVPGLAAFRFPVKYLAISAFAIAVLFAYGWQLIEDQKIPLRRIRILLGAAMLVALAAYVVVAWLLIAPALPVRAFNRLAILAHVPAPRQGAEFLIFRARPLLTTFFLKLMAVTTVTWIAISPRRERRLAAMVLAAATVIDLAVANSSVNPTAPVEKLGPPAWTKIVKVYPQQRVYMGGRLEGYLDPMDVDAPKWARTPDDAEGVDQRYISSNQLMYAPSGWMVRETLSFDLPLLWSVDYARLMGRFKAATREERLRFLSRVGTRFCVLPTPPFPGAVPLASLYTMEQMQLYDCAPSASRVAVVPDALIGPDVSWQIEGLFQERFDPNAGVLVSEPPPAASGVAGPPVRASAVIAVDEPNRVVVRAGLPGDGYLALFDTYDPDWTVDVDGEAATLMRANGLYRAVHLRSGQHTVTFAYRARAVRLGAGVSILATLGLGLWCLIDARQRAARAMPEIQSPVA
jgi:hypothetical protein